MKNAILFILLTVLLTGKYFYLRGLAFSEFDKLFNSHYHIVAKSIDNRNYHVYAAERTGELNYKLIQNSSIFFGRSDEKRREIVNSAANFVENDYSEYYHVEFERLFNFPKYSNDYFLANEKLRSDVSSEQDIYVDGQNIINHMFISDVDFEFRVLILLRDIIIASIIFFAFILITRRYSFELKKSKES